MIYVDENCNIKTSFKARYSGAEEITPTVPEYLVYLTMVIVRNRRKPCDIFLQKPEIGIILKLSYVTGEF